MKLTLISSVVCGLIFGYFFRAEITISIVSAVVWVILILLDFMYHERHSEKVNRILQDRRIY